MGYFWLTYLFVTVSIVLFPLASTLATWSTNIKIFLLTFFIPPLKLKIDTEKSQICSLPSPKLETQE